eukprot:15054766-Heterocapsa_arctica.AAC.1
MSTSRRIRSWTMPRDLLAFLLKLFAIQDAILPLLRFHRPRIPKLEHIVVALVALVQRSAGA